MDDWCSIHASVTAWPTWRTTPFFGAGTRSLWSWGEVAEVAAELYRGRGIEGTDTVFLQASLKDGPRLSCAMSHACHGRHWNEERVVCKRAVFTYTIEVATLPMHIQRYEIRWHDGRVESGARESRSFLAENLQAYLGYIRGMVDRPVNRLVDCLPFVHLNDLAYVAAGQIVTIPRDALSRTEDGFVAIRGIDEIAKRFQADGLFPSRQGLSWAVPGGLAGIDQLPTLHPVIERMAAAWTGSQEVGS